MIFNRKFSTVLMTVFIPIFAFGAPYENLVKNYSRSKSSAMVRLVRRPTLANLDYAAYINNPIRFDPAAYKPKHSRKVFLKDMTFNGALVEAHSVLEKTPLTDEEKDNPLAWVPLQNYLWRNVKTNAFVEIAASINGYKWSDKSISRPYQEIVTAYLHGSGKETQLWVKVEFASWVDFLEGIGDNDHNGQKEIYGKLELSSIDSTVTDKAFQWVRSEYMAKVLTMEEISDWANVLASYWYPTLNTDVVDVSADKKWPLKDTPAQIVKELGGLVVDAPAAVICGKPFGKPLYNVFVVENARPAETEPVKETPIADTTHIVNHTKDSSVSRNFKDNCLRFAGELTIHGGDYGLWAHENAAAYGVIEALIKKLPSDQMGFEGADGWLFFRKEISYMFGGDLSKQPEDKNPLPHIVEFKKMCDDRNIDLLFVVVPNKSDVYFEKLYDAIPRSVTLVNPYGRKFLRDLQESGVEVIDLLPLFLKAKRDDQKSFESLYQKQDTHWTNRGLQIAAAAIADRIKEYSWFPEAKKSAISFLIHDTTFLRLGDIVDKLPENRRGDYPPAMLQASQIRTSDGKLFQQNNRCAPLLLIGDSFTGVFELVDCKSAGIGANIAALTSLPVDIITSWGGGPLVREKMLRARSNDLGFKRLIIYMMVARDLYNYSEGWGK
jgi:alginate O-acetyltransferase complex protein AlgJ